jgi:hypothetical protein
MGEGCTIVSLGPRPLGAARFEMTSEPQAIGSGKNLAARLPEVDFAVILCRVIESTGHDSAQLRNAVYELARIKLRRGVCQRYPLEVRRLALALESAIEGVETIYSKHDELRALRSLQRLIESSEIGRSELMIEPREPLLVINQPAARTADANHRANRASVNVARLLRWPGAAPLLRGAIVAVFAMVLCLGVSQSGLLRNQAPQLAAVQDGGKGLDLPANSLQQSSPFPLPAVYGVYAVSGGQLYELETLPGRVPDPRVFMSGPIRTLSRTVLPDGHIAFIVYRRDLASSAPERVTVRVIARIMRAMTFNTAGQVSVDKVDDSWTIRNVSYEFRVAPLSGSSEMLMFRPENVDFVFPAGRYGLVIKGQAYDFTVAGPITEAAQCLESVKASNGTLYSECEKTTSRPENRLGAHSAGVSRVAP